MRRSRLLPSVSVVVVTVGIWTATIRGQKLGIVKELEVAAKAGYQAIEPWVDGIEATKRIKEEWPEIRVVGLSVNDSNQLMEAMLAAGAAAFVSKDTAPEQLYDAILSVMAREVPADQVKQTRLF